MAHHTDESVSGMAMMMIGFSRPRKWMPLSWLIMKWMRTDYSHTFFITRIAGVEMVVHAHVSGVDIMPKSKFINKNRIVWAIDYDNRNNDKQLTFAMLNIDARYGWLSLLSHPFGVKFGDGRKTMTCSEFLARAFDMKFENVDSVTPAQIKEYLEQRIIHAP